MKTFSMNFFFVRVQAKKAKLEIDGGLEKEPRLVFSDFRSITEVLNCLNCCFHVLMENHQERMLSFE